MNVHISVLWAIILVSGLGCSLVPDPDPYPSGDAGGGAILDMMNPVDLRGLPPLTDPNRRDAGRLDASGQAPEMDAGPRMPDAEVAMAVLTCQEQCQTTDQCNDSHECIDGRCQPDDEFNVCQQPDFCLAVLSGWNTSCRADAECPGDNVVCIRVGPEGRCAEMFAAEGCANPELSEITRLRFADQQGRISVCGQVRAVCREGVCVLRCRGDEDCSSDEQKPRCDVDAGRCVCIPDSCTRNASACGPAGRCQCVVDEDCTDGPVDRCYSGRCGCSSAAICPGAVHSGTEVVCQP